MTPDVKRRTEMLGMHPATASGKLLRNILFDFVTKSGAVCFRCAETMTRDNFSIEHKEAWMSSKDPLASFFDLDNVAYSHQKCNYAATTQKQAECGTYTRYINHGCRCDPCKDANKKMAAKYYTKEKRKDRYKRTGH